jgi:uncharacterized protein YecE (DUF72 family)
MLENFVKDFPVGVPLAVEARHEDWFNNAAIFNRLFNLLEEYHISPVISDVSGRRDVLHMRLTTETLLVRFVGHGLHPTDFTRIDDWTERLGEWFDKGLSQVFFFIHEPKEVFTPEMAIYFLSRLEKMGGVETRGPALMEQPPLGEQMSLF